jgi:hypothetical protein
LRSSSKLSAMVFQHDVGQVVGAGAFHQRECGRRGRRRGLRGQRADLAQAISSSAAGRRLLGLALIQPSSARCSVRALR